MKQTKLNFFAMPTTKKSSNASDWPSNTGNAADGPSKAADGPSKAADARNLTNTLNGPSITKNALDESLECNNSTHQPRNVLNESSFSSRQFLRPPCKRKSTPTKTFNPKRKFNVLWLQQFPWLMYDETTRLATCLDCSKNPSSGVDLKWINGVGEPVKKETFVCHDKSRIHKENVQSAKAKTAPAEAPLAICVKKMDAAMFKHLRYLFEIAYYIAVNEKPFTDFPHLLALANKLEVPILRAYESDKQCKSFIHFIAKIIREDLVKKVKNAQFVSILVDGSTDRTDVERINVYARYVHDGEVNEDLLGNVELASATASDYMTALIGLFDLLGFNYKNKFWIIGLGTDGAATMVGKKSGLATQLRKECVGLLSVWCVAHRLQLAILDVCKNIDYLPLFDQTIKSIYKFYRGSPKRLKQLENCAQVLSEELLKLQNIHSVRWLVSKVGALKALLNNWSVVCTHLEDISNDKSTDSDKAKGFLKELKQFKFLKMLHFLVDFYMVLKPLCEALQSKQLIICEMKQKIKYSVQLVQEFSLKCGQNEQLFNATVNADTSTCQYKGINLTNVGPGAKQFQIVRANIIEQTQKYLNERLESVSSNVISSMYILDSLCWPEKDSILNFGIDELDEISQHVYNSNDSFNKVVQTLHAEWADYKFCFKEKSFKTALSECSKQADRFPTLLPVLIFCATLPVNTASCERGFSYQNRIKTDYRQSLNSETLDDLLQIAVNGVTVNEFDPSRAIDKWYYSTERKRYTGAYRT